MGILSEADLSLMDSRRSARSEQSSSSSSTGLAGSDGAAAAAAGISTSIFSPDIVVLIIFMNEERR